MKRMYRLFCLFPFADPRLLLSAVWLWPVALALSELL